MRKVFLEVKLNLTIIADEGVDITETVRDHLSVRLTTGDADLEDVEVNEIEIIDSK